MEEELLGDIVFKKNDDSADTLVVTESLSGKEKPDGSGNEASDDDSPKDILLKPEVAYNEEEQVKLIKAATMLISDCVEKLGPAYEMNRSIAIMLLNDVLKSTSGEAAIRKLEELISIMEHMLAEANSITSWNERKSEGHGVVVSFPSDASVTIYDSREPNQILVSSDFVDMSVGSTAVKRGLLAYMTIKFPEYMDQKIENSFVS